jgi:hypothetical protein
MCNKKSWLPNVSIGDKSANPITTNPATYETSRQTFANCPRRWRWRSRHQPIVKKVPAKARTVITSMRQFHEERMAFVVGSIVSNR